MTQSLSPRDRHQLIIYLNLPHFPNNQPAIHRRESNHKAHQWLPGDDEVCQQLDKCKAHYGTCKEWCDPYKYERELKGLCDPIYWYRPTTPAYGYSPWALKPQHIQPPPWLPIPVVPACKCCAPKCEESPACTLWGGICVNGAHECPTKYGFMVVDGCKGYNCKCCKPGNWTHRFLYITLVILAY